jgi:inner membrane protein
MLDKLVEWLGKAMEFMGSEVLSMENGYAWILLGLVLIILESLGAALFCASLGLAAIITGLIAFTGLFSLTWLLVVYAAAALAVFAASRPLANRMTGGKSQTNTNIHGLIGQCGLVVEEIKGMHDPGYVKIAGDQWRSVPLRDEMIPVGTKVYILQIEGATLTVDIKPPQQEELA